MEYVVYEGLHQHDKDHIDGILGSLRGKPYYVAILNSAQGWVLFKIDFKSGENKPELTEIDTIQTVDGVISFFQIQGLTPLCPKLEIEDEIVH